MLRNFLFILGQLPILFFCFSASISYAEIDLFDSNRGKPPVGAEKNKPIKSKPNSRIGQKKLELMFIGMSQSDTTVLYFKDKRNKQIKVQFDQQKDTTLPGYDDLVIEKIKNRVVYVKDINHKYCQNDIKRGILCQAKTNTLEMKLVRKYVAASKIASRPAKNNNPVKRIAPKDVPADKRLIKTPFGDRLLPRK